jgi:hypothetical protein
MFAANHIVGECEVMEDEGIAHMRGQHGGPSWRAASNGADGDMVGVAAVRKSRTAAQATSAQDSWDATHRQLLCPRSLVSRSRDLAEPLATLASPPRAHGRSATTAGGEPRAAPYGGSVRRTGVALTSRTQYTMLTASRSPGQSVAALAPARRQERAPAVPACSSGRRRACPPGALIPTFRRARSVAHGLRL